MVTTAVGLPGGAPYCPVSARRGDLPPQRLPTRFNVLFRQHAGVSLLRLHITGTAGQRILYRLSIVCALRLPLRPRLTLIRLALIRNPWPSGEGVSRPLCRYLCLHLLFRGLQQASRPAFAGGGMLPYQSIYWTDSTSSAPDLCPIIIHAGPLD